MRTLLIDIETSPNVGYTWGKWKQDVIDWVQEWHLMAVAWKWLDEELINCLTLTDFARSYRRNKHDDRMLAEAAWKLLDEADIVIGHNVRSFDIKKLNSRFLYHDLGRPSSFDTIDTLKQYRAHFKFNQNSLGYLVEHLDLGTKDKGGAQLFMSCFEGDPEAWAKLRTYNVKDVAMLEALYVKVRPWVSNHPPVYRHGCPRCGSQRTHRRGFRQTQTRSYQRWHCLDCGGYHRDTASEPGKTIGVRAI